MSRKRQKNVPSLFQSVLVDEGKGVVPTFQRRPEGTPVINNGYFEVTQEDVQNKLSD